MNVTMVFEHLKEHPDAVEKLAGWHYLEWGNFYPEENLQDFIADLRESMQGEPVPATWLLLDKEGVCWGSASIVEQDMTTNTDLGPWLASVYIHPDKRGLGLGRALINEAMKRCRERGLEELFLFTPGQEGFYQTLGWKTRKQEIYQGKNVSIMAIRLKP
jgi:N-acetylglutamate synthase-like GNAT family acetyltransferase